MSAPVYLRAHPDGVSIAVWAKPRASRTKIAGVQGEALAIALAAPPVDGAANEELIAFLAKELGVAQSAVSVASGQTGRNKRVVVLGVTMESAMERLKPR